MPGRWRKECGSLLGALQDLLLPKTCLVCGYRIVNQDLDNRLPAISDSQLCWVCHNSLFRPLFCSTTFLTLLNLAIPGWAVNFYQAEARKMLLKIKYGPPEITRKLAWKLGYYHGLALAEQLETGAPVTVVPAPSAGKKTMPGRLIEALKFSLRRGLETGDEPGRWCRPEESFTKAVKVSGARTPVQGQPPTSNQLVGSLSAGLVAGMNRNLGELEDGIPLVRQKSLLTLSLQEQSVWKILSSDSKHPKSLADRRLRRIEVVEPVEKTGSVAGEMAGASAQKEGKTDRWGGRREGTPEKIILVDDVITTGVTMKLMVDAIERSGREVVGIFSLLIAKENPDSAVS